MVCDKCLKLLPICEQDRLTLAGGRKAFLCNSCHNDWDQAVRATEAWVQREDATMRLGVMEATAIAGQAPNLIRTAEIWAKLNAARQKLFDFSGEWLKG